MLQIGSRGKRRMATRKMPPALEGTSAMLRFSARTKNCKMCSFVVLIAVASCQAVMLGATGARAQTPAADSSGTYLYKGADRTERLVAKAREEGSLTFYTSMATTE